MASALPVKGGIQTHLPLDASHVAPIPQTTVSQRCLQRPLIQTCGSAHDFEAPH